MLEDLENLESLAFYFLSFLKILRILILYKDNINNISLTNTASDKGEQVTYLLVDRIVADGEQSTLNRFADSVQTAFFEGKGECKLAIQLPSNNEAILITFSQRFEADGITFVAFNLLFVLICFLFPNTLVNFCQFEISYTNSTNKYNGE